MMACRGLPRIAALVGLVVCCLITVFITAEAQQNDDLNSLDQQTVQLSRAGKYQEATEVAQRALSLAERQFGPDDTSVAEHLNNLALLYETQSRYVEAEPLMKRALSIAEK